MDDPSIYDLTSYVPAIPLSRGSTERSLRDASGEKTREKEREREILAATVAHTGIGVKSFRAAVKITIIIFPRGDAKYRRDRHLIFRSLNPAADFSLPPYETQRDE